MKLQMVSDVAGFLTVKYSGESGLISSGIDLPEAILQSLVWSMEFFYFRQ